MIPEMARPEPGEEAEVRVVVTEEMLVDLGGRRIHPLYATAWMVRHMEEASRILIERHLGEDEDAMGYAISVTHERPARAGDALRVRARVTRADRRECETEVEAIGPAGTIGRGRIIQRYIEAGRFERGDER